MMVKIPGVCLCLTACLLLITADLLLAADASGKKQIDAGNGVHAQPWAFGQSRDRDAPIWSKGIGGKDISRKSSKGGTSKAADTSAGIGRAVNDARKPGTKGTFDLGMENESSHWKVAPDQSGKRPDEDIARERHRVFRAYAGVQAGEDFNIGLGPELIVTDEQYSEENARGDQPSSSFGLGMKFQYDF